MFDNVELSPGMVGGSEKDIAAAQPLAAMMSEMLIAYAKTGDPNGLSPRGGAMPKWPVYGLKERETMMFDTVSRWRKTRAG